MEATILVLANRLLGGAAHTDAETALSVLDGIERDTPEAQHWHRWFLSHARSAIADNDAEQLGHAEYCAGHLGVATEV